MKYLNDFPNLRDSQARDAAINESADNDDKSGADQLQDAEKLSHRSSFHFVLSRRESY